MNILTKNIHDLKFSAIVEFCDQKILEGTQLDYKRKLPKDLAKHFATFSNTQGGLIIIGVGEDSKGLPTTVEGVSNDGKLIDQIHQFASNVTPLPTYDVCATDEVGGNVFILVRIDEGAAAPYTTTSDPTVWIRNGNISTPASREELLRLTNKRESAQQLREANHAFANQYFTVRVAEAEEQRKQLVQSGKVETYQHALNGVHCAVLTIAMQPYQPNTELTTPQQLFDRHHEYCGNEFTQTIFNYVPTDSLPGGLTAFSWNEKTGVLSNDQHYVNGLCFAATDVLEHNGTQSLIRMLRIGAKLHTQLKLLRNYYKQAGYSGLIEGVVELKGGVGAAVAPIGSVRHPLFQPDAGKVRLPLYSWPLHFNSNQLYDDTELGKVFAKAIKEISWGLGVYDLPDTILGEYMQVNGYVR